MAAHWIIRKLNRSGFAVGRLGCALRGPVKKGRTGLALSILALAACSDASAPPPTASKAPGRNPPAVAAAIPPSPPSLSGNYLAAIHARSRNDSFAAAKYMGEVLKADPENATILQSVFLLKLQDGKMADAILLARKLLDQQPGNQIAALTLIAEAFRTGDFATARTQAARLDQQGLGKLLQPLLGAWAAAGLGEWDAAQAQLAPLNERSSFAPFYSYHGALIAAIAQRPELASQKFGILMADKSVRSARAAQAYGQFLETQRKHSQAAEVYRNAQNPLQPLPILAAAEARNREKRPAALLVANAAEGAAEVFYGMGNVLAQDNSAGALPLLYLRLADYLRPDFEECRMLLANVFSGLQRHEDAIAVSETIPAGSPLYESARIQIALNQSQLNRTDEAIKTLERYQAEYPNARDALIALADLLRSHDRFKDAVPVYNRVLAETGDLKPHHWPLLYARGISLERAGEWPPAERDLLRALELEPDQPNVLNYLAYSWIDKGVNLPRAKSMIEKAASQRPDDGAIIDSLGWMHYRMGDFHRAVETLENAITLMPQDAVINDHLGDAYWQVGRRLEAEFQWRRALTFDPDPDVRRSIEQKLQFGLSGAEQPAEPAGASAQKS